MTIINIRTTTDIQPMQLYASLAMFIQRLTYETQGRDFLLQLFKDDQQNKHFKDRLG